MKNKTLPKLLIVKAKISNNYVQICEYMCIFPEKNLTNFFAVFSGIFYKTMLFQTT